ncbi:acyltransferase [Chryseobacterium carnipullorum]|nr:acyltransferase [Chryseobacterium carnipullorum]
MHVSEFLVGNLAGLFFVNNFKQKNYDIPVVLIFTAIMLALIFIPLFYHNGLMALLFIPLIILISRNNGVVTQLFSLKPLEYLGEASYAVYITHIPILYILREFLKWQKYTLDINSIFWIYLIFLILTSLLFYQFVEKPLRDYLKKLNIR